MDAGIQLQGCEASLIIILFIIMLLPSMALDSGIHARMTCLKIVASNNEYLLKNMNTSTISIANNALRTSAHPTLAHLTGLPEIPGIKGIFPIGGYKGENYNGRSF
jgi:hypothetical protein